jgi:glutaredoxin
MSTETFILYQRETCPWCQPVRQRLTELLVRYTIVNVPKKREERHELIERTGAHFIPAIVAGDVVVTGRLEHNKHVLDFIENRFSAGASASEKAPVP